MKKVNRQQRNSGSSNDGFRTCKGYNPESALERAGSHTTPPNPDYIDLLLKHPKSQALKVALNNPHTKIHLSQVQTILKLDIPILTRNILRNRNIPLDSDTAAIFFSKSPDEDMQLEFIRRHDLVYPRAMYDKIFEGNNEVLCMAIVARRDFFPTPCQLEKLINFQYRLEIILQDRLDIPLNANQIYHIEEDFKGIPFMVNLCKARMADLLASENANEPIVSFHPKI